MEILFTIVIVGMIYVGVRPRVATATKKQRRGEAYYLQVRKELGIDPYTPAELAQMEAEERYTQAKNEAGESFWSGNGNYVEWR
jgi:hypothetical protein